MSRCPRCAAVFDDRHRFCPYDGVALAGADADPHLGLILLDQFELVAVAGRGATGTVYRAWQAPMERWVAVKVLHAELLDQPDMIERMQREARVIARLSHPSIVSAFASGSTPEGRPFLVMEYVDGRSLESELHGHGGALAPERALPIVRQIAGALAEAHAAGVIHRDLKPANVMLVQRRLASDVVKLLDFGIAKVEREESVLTRQGAICGTPHYLAPEQAAGEKVDHRADLYGVGVLLYRMVTGRVPFGGTGLAAMLGHLHDRPVPPAELVPGVDRDLSALIMRCLEKSPADRPQSAEELDQLLAACESPAIETLFEAGGSLAAGFAVAATLEAEAPPRRRRRVGLVTGLLATAALAGLFLATGGGRRWTQGEPLSSVAPGSGLAPAAFDPPSPVPERGGEPPRRALVVAEGGYSLRVLLPERMLVGVDYEIVLEAWDPEGEPLATAEMILTLDDPEGVSRGIAAKPTEQRGRYRFNRSFGAAGSHQLRVFPPAGGTSIRLFFDVVDPHAA